MKSLPADSDFGGDFWSERYRDYVPAGGIKSLEPTELLRRRKEQCRAAARASAVKRKRLARGRRIAWASDGNLPLRYKPIRQATRSEFDALYGATAAREGWSDDPRGRNTAWALYAAETAAYRVRRTPEGKTTNRQRGASLSSQGRPRCRRTIQYTRARLESMGLVRYHWVKRAGANRGHKDYLRVELLPWSGGNGPALERRRLRLRARANCTPLPPTSVEAGALAFQASRTCLSPASPAELAPPSAADRAPPSGGGEVPDDEERAQRFRDLKRACGWPVKRRPGPGWDGHAPT